MYSAEEIKARMLEALRAPSHGDPLEMFLHLGVDTPRRASIARELMSKSVDMSKLVRVQRSVSRNGKTYVTHVWVLPSKVRKGDIVTQNKAAYEQWAKENGGGVELGSAKKLVNPLAKLKGNKAQPGSAAQKKTAGTGKPGKAGNTKAKLHEPPQPKDVEAKPEAPGHKAGGATNTQADPGSDKKQQKSAAPEDAPVARPEPAAGAQAANEPKEEQPEIFTNGTGDMFLTAEVYRLAKLRLTDNLASKASFDAAVNALQHIKKTHPGQSDTVIQKELEALIIQHVSVQSGKTVLEKAAEEYKGTEAAKHYNPILIACAVSDWTYGGRASIRARSLDHDADADPVSNLYSKCLTDMVMHSSTVQSSTLYRGIHVRQDFLRQALENGTITTKGLISASADEASARRSALQTDSGEVGAVLELPKSLKRKTLELGGETLLTMGVKFPTTLTVKRVTKDKDGIYHVQLAPKGTKPDEPVADDGIYAELGAQKPGENHQKLPEVEGSQIDAAAYKQILAYVTGKSKDDYGRYEVLGALPQVYGRYGRDGAVAVLAEYARTAIKENAWTEKFESSKTGYDPKLMEMVHDDWIHSAYGSIRKMENTSLDEKSNGSDVYHKICNDVLHSIVEKDGQEQPSMLYRGMKPYGEKMQIYLNSKVGDEIGLGALSSFSATAAIANKFSGTGGVVLKLPKETKTRCAYCAGLGNENEYIVADARWRVTKREEKAGRVYLTLAPG